MLNMCFLFSALLVVVVVVFLRRSLRPLTHIRDPFRRRDGRQRQARRIHHRDH